MSVRLESQPLPDRTARERVTDGVHVLQLPDDAARREQLRVLGIPRVLVVGVDAAPPDVVDELEDWLRAPVDGAELSARIATLQRRRERQRPRPVLGDDGMLWSGEHWVALPPGHVAPAQLLVARFGQVVAADDIVAAYHADGSSAHAEAVKATMTRLGRKLRALDLELTKVRGVGYLLDYR